MNLKEFVAMANQYLEDHPEFGEHEVQIPLSDSGTQDVIPDMLVDDEHIGKKIVQIWNRKEFNDLMSWIEKELARYGKSKKKVVD